MNILLVSHMFPNNVNPGYGVFVKEQAKFVAKKTDLQVMAPLPFFPLAVLFSKYKSFNKIRKAEIIDGLKVTHPQYFFIPKVLKFLDAWFYSLSLNRNLRNLIRKEKIQILHFHWGYPDAIALLRLAKKTGLKTVLTIHGNESICYFENSLRKKIVQKYLKKFDYLIVVSNDLKNKIIQYYDVPKTKITVMPNGINTENFYSIDKNEARHMCGIDHKKQIILTVCRLSHEKGIEYLFQAIQKIKEINVELLIAGDGPLKEKLLVLARQLKISDKIKFLGTIVHEEIYKFYNAADIFCLPSLWEGCPCTIIEAMACGTPVVATKVGGIPDMINKETGVLVEPKNPVALAVALTEALNKKWNHEQISAIGQSNSWDNVADKVIEVYKKILEK
ncbi:MAG: glycosyltransferase family 4 protein [Candidatus Omnitrophota bacterium]